MLEASVGKGLRDLGAGFSEVLPAFEMNRVCSLSRWIEMDGEKMQDLTTTISLLAMSQQEKRSSLAPEVALVGAALYLYVNLFASPRVPFLLGGDQTYFWMRAMWMLDGKRIYRDFLQFTQPPGLDLLFAALFKFFGLRMWVTNVVVLMLGLAFAVMVYLIASRFVRRGSAALAAAVILVPIYGKALNATHHWFGVLAVLFAVIVVLRGFSALRIAAAGALLALGSFFSLYHGLAGLFAFSVFLLLRSLHGHAGWMVTLRKQAFLFGAYIAAMALLNAHYIVTAGLGQLWYFQVTCVRQFAVSAYRGVRPVFPLPPTLHNLPGFSEYIVVYLLVAATLAALFLSWRRRREFTSIEPIVLLALVALFLFGEVAVSPNWLRIYAVSAPAAILLAGVIEQLPRLRVCVMIGLWVWVILLGAHQTVTHHRMQRDVVDLPAGRVATTQQLAAKLNLVSQNVKPGDPIFLAAWPGLYLPLQVRNPVAFETVNVSDMPRPGDVQLVRQQLGHRRVPYVLWAARLDEACASGCRDRLTPLREYVHAAYVPVVTWPDGDTLWRRRE